MKISLRELRNVVRSVISENVLLTEAAVGEKESRELLKKFNKGMSTIGLAPNVVDSLTVVGIGTHGTAFETPDGKVVKITNDAKEAEAAATLMGKNVKNIVTYYDVWEFGNTGLYGLLQEKLIPLESSEAKNFNDALVATALPLWIRRAPDDWDKVKAMSKEHIMNSIKKKFPDDHNSPEARRYGHEINTQWNLLINKYNVRDMFETLKSLGIDFHDYHAGNLMKRRDGTLVLIDLGISVIRGDAKGQMRKMSETLNVRSLNCSVKKIFS